MAGKARLQFISVIHGKNAYARRQALERVIERELDGGDRGLNLIQIEGAQAEAAKVLDDVRTYSLLGDRRVVVVRDGDKFMGRAENRSALEKYLESGCETGCLILVCEGLDKRTRFAKVVGSAGEVIECAELKGKALSGWICETARGVYGKRMGYQAAARLMDNAGTGQEGLDSELAKLSLFVGNRGEIGVDDVDTLVGTYREENVFAVMDAIAAGDAPTAIAQWQQVLMTDRAAPGRAIGGLAYGVRRLIEARWAYDQGGSPATLARQFWMRPDEFERRMKRFSAERLTQLLRDLLSADVRTKTGLGNVGREIERFIVKHSAKVA